MAEKCFANSSLTIIISALGKENMTADFCIFTAMLTASHEIEFSSVRSPPLNFVSPFLKAVLLIYLSNIGSHYLSINFGMPRI